MVDNAPKEKKLESRGVLCAKCEHLNPPQSSICNRCGAHLFLTCKACGQSNLRVLTRCTACNKRLHADFLARFERGRGRKRKSTLVVLLVLGLVALLFFLLMVFAFGG